MRLGLGLICGSTLGCSVLGATASLEREEPLACTSDAHCSVGHCLEAVGICSQEDGELGPLLFEVTPPASDAVYGGARFLTVQNFAETSAEGSPDRGIAPGWKELNVRPRVAVSGFVQAAPDQAECLSRAKSSLPVTLTFTPRERLYGLSTEPYVLSTSFDDALGEYTFRGSIPPGHYDVYMRPDTAALGESCVAIPQIFRDRLVGETFQLAQPTPAPLHLTIPWTQDRSGWLVDMVHAATGEIISNRVRLGPENMVAGGASAEASLYYSRVENDFVTSGEELVRLTPPPGSQAGTVLLQRSGVELAAPGEGVIGDVFRFGEPVEFHAWVWKEEAFDSPVPGSVRFEARDLDEAPDGVLVSFSGSAMVDPRGQVRLALLPGSYRVRVTPPGAQVADLGYLSGYESSVTVWPNEGDNGRVQSGHVIEVPPAVSLEGQVLDGVSGEPLDGVEVRASASNLSLDPCAGRDTNPASPDCSPATTAVLQKALAQDPFVPRTRSALTDSNGNFRIEGLDCGRCQPGAGARFDVSVRPPLETHLPWLLLRPASLYADDTMRIPLQVPAPVAHAIRLTYGDPLDGNAQGLSGALVRVFALLDRQSRVVSDPTALVPCVTLTSATSPCVQSLVQVAEVRSGTNGEFLLLLPPALPRE